MKKVCPDTGTATGLPTEKTVFEFTPDQETVIVEVVEAVATVAGVDPQRLQPRLHDVIDPDALARCVCSGGPGTRVSFEMGRYHVTVDGTGTIVVKGA